MTRAESTPSGALNIIKKLSDRDPGMPLGAALVLLHLHRHANTTLKDLRPVLKVSASAVSRHIYYWPHDIVAVQIDPVDKRGRILNLTPKGHDIVRELEGNAA